jgi:hypothetical protein
MLKIRQLHLIKENWAWNAKTPWCNYYWADNETPRHSYPAFCQRGHATTVCAKDLDVHVTCEACAAVEKDSPGIMTGLSGMVKDVRFDDDAASQLVLNLKRRAKFFDFSDETLLNVLDRLIKDRDEKQSATSKQEGRRKTLPFWRARDALMSLHKALVEFHSSSLGEDWRCLRVKKHIDDAIKVLETANAEAEEETK